MSDFKTKMGMAQVARW